MVFSECRRTPEFPPFCIAARSSDFPRTKADRLAMLAAVIKQAAGGSNGC